MIEPEHQPVIGLRNFPVNGSPLFWGDPGAAAGDGEGFAIDGGFNRGSFDAGQPSRDGKGVGGFADVVTGRDAPARSSLGRGLRFFFGQEVHGFSFLWSTGVSWPRWRFAGVLLPQ